MRSLGPKKAEKKNVWTILGNWVHFKYHKINLQQPINRTMLLKISKKKGKIKLIK